MIYKKKGIVGASATDANANLSTIGTFCVIEDAITEMMGKLKIDGLTAKKLYNAMWVFTKNRVKFLRPLAWAETYSVESFISLVSLAKINIDTAIKNANGEVVVYSKTELCALDLETGKIRKTATVGVGKNIKVEPSLLMVEFAKFGEEKLTKVETLTVRSTNIDFCHHTNNVEYIRFLLNTYSVKELENIKEMEVVYINQSFEEDTLDIYKNICKNGEILVIMKDNKQIVKSEILRY